MFLAIIYKKLFKLLKEKGYSSTLWLRQNGLYAATVDTTDTINRLCKLLNCQPGDIMEYVPDEEEQNREE